MTLAAVWVEATPGSTSALCFASDSRTSPGPIEGVTKVWLFGRRDIAAVWAGDVRYASLVINHLEAFLTATEAMRGRDVDVFFALKAAGRAAQDHLVSAMKPPHLWLGINDDAKAPEDTTILVGGYSIARASFVVLQLRWNAHLTRWERSIEFFTAESLKFIGDKDARRGAYALVERARGHRTPESTNDWHMEPLTVIDRRCRDVNKTTVGPPLQMAKVLRHGNGRAFAFREAMSGKTTIRTVPLRQQDIEEISPRGLVIDLASWNLGAGRYKGGRAPKES